MKSVYLNQKRDSDQEISYRSRQPIVLLGGFLSYASLYTQMVASLEAYTKAKVYLVRATTLDWLGVAFKPLWLVVLNKLNHIVRIAAQASNTGRITLVTHSAGGLYGRMYLSSDSFYGKNYQGCHFVSHLITLGTPHYSNGTFKYGGILSDWVNQHYPGATFSEKVTYTAVAGKAVKGDPTGTSPQRRAYKVYKEMTGDGEDWGDGVVSVKSALLEGAQHIELEDVAHYWGISQAWYGDRDVIPMWWDQSH